MSQGTETGDAHHGVKVAVRAEIFEISFPTRQIAFARRQINMTSTMISGASPPRLVWPELVELVSRETKALMTLSVSSQSRGLSESSTSAGSSTANVNAMGDGKTSGDGSTRRGGTHQPIDPDLSPEEQLSQLVEHHLDAVYRVAFSVVRDRALAEDVSQDAILKAWTALPTFRGESSLRSWLLRITHNTAISTLRRRREELRDPDLLPERVAHTSTERQVVDRLSLDAFEQALEELDELSRTIVVLREIENMAYDEIAEVLDVGLPTVKTRLLRARRTLAASLSDWRP